MHHFTVLDLCSHLLYCWIEYFRQVLSAAQLARSAFVFPNNALEGCVVPAADGGKDNKKDTGNSRERQYAAMFLCIKQKILQ